VQFSTSAYILLLKPADTRLPDNVQFSTSAYILLQ